MNNQTAVNNQTVVNNQTAVNNQTVVNKQTAMNIQTVVNYQTVVNNKTVNIDCPYALYLIFHLWLPVNATFIGKMLSGVTSEGRLSD